MSRTTPSVVSDMKLSNLHGGKKMRKNSVTSRALTPRLQQRTETVAAAIPSWTSDATSTRAILGTAAIGIASLMMAGETAQAQQPGAAPLPTVQVDAPRARATQARPVRQAQPRRAPAATVRQPAPAPIAVDTGLRDGRGYNTQTASSPKQTAPLLDTPATVTVIPQQIIREQGARNLTEVLRNTPGITFDAGENGFSTSANNFKLRGFDSSGNIFYDGARDNGSYTRDVFNIDRVEVIKGPSADNGRGGPGGYVNLVSKVPWLANVGYADVTFGFSENGTKPQKRATTDLNYVVAPNTAVRLNAMIEDSGIPGRDLADNRAVGFAPSVAFGLGTDLRIFLSYEHLTRRDRPDWGIPGAGVPGMINFNPIAGSASRNNFYGLRSDRDDVSANSGLARVEYDINRNVTISNQLRVSHVDRYAQFTVPTGFTPGTGAVTTQRQYYDRTNTSISNLTNLTAKFATGTLQHTLSTGIEVSHEESNSNRYGTQNTTTNIFNPNPDRAIAAPLSPTERAGIGITTVAAYLYDTIKLNEQWQVMGGLRAEQYQVDIDSKTIAGLPTGGNDGVRKSEFTLGGKTAVVYKPVPFASVYASFGVSHLPPGSFLSNPDISRTGDNAFPGFVANADPTRFHNYEIGTKVDFFGGRLSTTAALFRTEKKNAPFTGRDPGETADSFKGYGQQIIQGIELGAAGQITEAWSVFGGVLLMESERRHSAYLDDVRRRASPGDYGTALRTSGDELAFTPNVSANLWTTYRFASLGWTIGGGVQYVGESFLGRPDDALRIIPNGTFGKLPAYTVFNLMTSYELRKDVLLRFNVDNVADNRYAYSSNWNGTRANISPSRTYRVSTSFRF